MIRTPTSRKEIYDWYTSSMRGERPAVHEDDPQCGWFKMREKKSGPWVPVRIWLHQPVENYQLTGPEVLRGSVGTFSDDREADPVKMWTRCAKRPISPTEYNRLYWGRDDTGLWALEEKPIAPTSSG